MANRQFHRIRGLTRTLAALLLIATGQAGASAIAAPSLALIDDHWGTSRISESQRRVTAFPLPLGPMEKVRGSWQLKDQLAFTGQLTRVTWQVTSVPVTDLFASVASELSRSGRVLFECNARACGNAAQWASRVYGERLLYGRAEYLRYMVIEQESGTWVTLFSAARTADRQYLHLDIAESN